MKMGSKSGGNVFTAINVILVLAALLAIVVSSRSFLFAVTSIILWIGLEQAPLKPVYRRLAFGVIIVSVFCLLVFFVKTDSSEGRMLIYKISWPMLKQNWLQGIGVGNFKNQYLLEQAQYFSKGNYTQKELLLADSTYYVFNDYAEILIELGLLGFIILLLGAIFAGYLTLQIKKKYPVERPFLLLLSAYIVLVILIAAFTTHILDKLYIKLILVFATGMIVLYVDKEKKSRRYILWFVVLAMITIVGFYQRAYLVNYSYYKKAEEVKQLRDTGFKNKALDLARQLYPKLREDGDFLVLYAGLLTQANYHNLANFMLKRAVINKKFYPYYLRLAESAYKTGNNVQAEQHYLMAINMVPNRFESRYSLLMFYVNTNNKKKAVIVAENIRSLAVKIPSYRVAFIRKKAMEYLLSIK